MNTVGQGRRWAQPAARSTAGIRVSGVFYIGLGDEFNADKLEAYPPSAVIVLPGNISHFHWAKSGEYVSQVTASGLKRRSAE